jgi:hypothetical protein
MGQPSIRKYPSGSSAMDKGAATSSEAFEPNCPNTQQYILEDNVFMQQFLRIRLQPIWN